MLEPGPGDVAHNQDFPHSSSNGFLPNQSNRPGIAIIPAHQLNGAAIGAAPVVGGGAGPHTDSGAGTNSVPQPPLPSGKQRANNTIGTMSSIFFRGSGSGGPSSAANTHGGPGGTASGTGPGFGYPLGVVGEEA